MTNGAGPELISPQRLADYLDIPIGTLYQWRYKGGGPPSIRVGRHVRYRAQDVELWLDQHTQASA